MKKSIKSIPAGEFKAKCLQLMQQVQDSHKSIIITKRGVPIAKLVPVDSAPETAMFGVLEGSVTIVEDIVSPINETWNADEA